MVNGWVHTSSGRRLMMPARVTPGSGAHALEELVVEDLDCGVTEVHVLRSLVEVLRAAEQDVSRQQPLGIEAGKVALLAQEPAHHQSRADQQHHRQCDFRDEQRAAAAGAACRSIRAPLP